MYWQSGGTDGIRARDADSAGKPGTAEEVAARTGLPLFRVRGGLREMAEVGLVELNDGAYSPTLRGLALLPA